jgi:phytoene dehydrogenase-like protein
MALTRRDAMLGLGASGAETFLPRAAWSEAPDYRLGDWSGDNFAPMHAIRDGLWSGPLPAPDRRVEVAIVGGGLAGLSVAALLRERDLILLEREAEPGGVAQAGRWREIEYALGSAYVVDLGEPFGPFYDMLGLKPRAVPDPVDRMLGDGPGAANPLEGELLQSYQRLQKLLFDLSKGPDFPKMPIAGAPVAALALDQVSLIEFLRRENIDARLDRFIDLYCLSALGAPAAGISAYAGVNFLSEISTRIHAFPGGNAAIARALVARVERAGAGRIVANAAVYAVEPNEGGFARIAWFDAQDGGEPRCVEARWVVVAAPYFFAARILRGVDPAATEKMRALRQGSVLVANCCFEGPIAPGAYDFWTPSASAFTDAVDAAAILPPDARPKDHGVLTVYAPSRDPRAGRARLLSQDRASFAGPIVEELRRFMPENFSQARLSEVRLTRWGHHHLIASPGIVALMRGLRKRFGNVLLAHSDGQGMPAVESAIIEAQSAAEIIGRG